MRRALRQTARTGLVLATAGLLSTGCSAADTDSDPDADSQPSAARVIGFMLAKLTSGKQPGPATRGEIAAAPDAPDTFTPSPAAEPRVADDDGATCEVPYSGPVTIVPVRNIAALHRAVNDRRHVEIVYSTEDTAIYEDGRVLTTRLENVGEHLNTVGWAGNAMTILGATARPAGSTSSYAWRAGDTSRSPNSKMKRRRRRRG